MIAKDQDGKDVHVHTCSDCTCLHGEGDNEDKIWLRAPHLDTETKAAWYHAPEVAVGPLTVLWSSFGVTGWKITDDGQIVDAVGVPTADVAEKCRSFIADLPPYAHACGGACRGVDVFETIGRSGGDGLEIQHCDDCARFDNDAEATAFLQGALRLKRNGGWE